MGTAIMQTKSSQVCMALSAVDFNWDAELVQFKFSPHKCLTVLIRHIGAHTYNVYNDSVEQVISLLPIHRVREQMDQGRVISHCERPLAACAASQADIIIEGS